MSYYCLLNNIRINSSNTGPAWARIEEYLLNHLQEARELDEGLTERLQGATSLATALSAMGWEFVVSYDGHLSQFTQTNDDVFNALHETLWRLLATALRGPTVLFFIFSAEDGNIVRWRFEEGMLHEDHVDRYIWSCEDVVIFPRKEVLSFLGKMFEGLNTLKNTVDIT